MSVIGGMNDDTIQACRDRSQIAGILHPIEVVTYMRAAYYVNGHGAPHYPLPVTQWVATTMREADSGDFLEASLYDEDENAPY